MSTIRAVNPENPWADFPTVGTSLLDTHQRGTTEIRQSLLKLGYEVLALTVVSSHTINSGSLFPTLIEHLVRSNNPARPRFSYLNKLLVVVDYDNDNHPILMASYDGLRLYTIVVERTAK